MKVAIITSGYLPVPASKGGAVENIVENFIIENEILQKIDFEIFSIFEAQAEDISKKYKHTKFHFIKPNLLVCIIDKLIYSFAKNVLKKEKTMSYRYIVQRLYFLRKISKKLKKENYDKIILENHSSLFLALKWKKNYLKYKDKYYYHVHNEIKSFYGCKEIIKGSRKILCVSNYIKNHVEKLLKIENTNIVKKMTNCINIEEFENITNDKKMEIRERYNIKENEKILLFTGRLTKEKGIRELLLAIRRIKKVQHFKLLVVGSFFFDTEIKNDFQIELENILADIKDKVIFTGYIKHEEINKIYRIADIAVLPSLWEDPAPLTIIESMASGLPIITTNSGGIPEYANNGCAIILERNEKIVEKLADAIVNLLNNEEKMKEMSKISKQNAKKLNLESFYNDLLVNLS